jgi:hypothetical protein
MEYSRNFGSNFPNSLIEVGTKKDVDNTVIGLINQYYSYMSSNNIDAANELYQANKDVLDAYSIKTKDFNLILEELYNMGLNLLQKTKIIVDVNEPVTMSDNSIWYEVLGDIE